VHCLPPKAAIVQSVTDHERDTRRKEDARQLANERASADPENAGLLTTATESNTTKLAAKNIRILLKKHFPGVKFSVRMRDYNALYVSWTDGPTKEAVEDYRQV
jgi:uncharacterized FlaG/YvyC family protein